MAILNPYLNFRAQAREAIEFYHSVFGGELALSTFKEFGMSSDPAEDDLIMHAQLTAPGGITLMAADVPPRMDVAFGSNISVSLSGGAADGDTLRDWFARLMEGGTIGQPLESAPWGDWFGQGVDRFGIGWLVNIGHA